MAPKPKVQYVITGILSAKQFWTDVAVPAYERFQAAQTGPNAIVAALAIWHVHEWVWHDLYPGVDNRHNDVYRKFQDDLIDECKELAWVRDIADAGKHRGLGRDTRVVDKLDVDLIYLVDSAGSRLVDSRGSALATEGPDLKIELTNGKAHLVSDTFAKVITFWQAHPKLI